MKHKITNEDQKLLEILIVRDKIHQKIVFLEFVENSNKKLAREKKRDGNVQAGIGYLKILKKYQEDLKKLRELQLKILTIITEIENAQINVQTMKEIEKGNEMLKGFNKELNSMDIEGIINEKDQLIKDQAIYDNLFALQYSKEDEEELEKLTFEETKMKLSEAPPVPVSTFEETNTQKGKNKPMIAILT